MKNQPHSWRRRRLVVGMLAFGLAAAVSAADTPAPTPPACRVAILGGLAGSPVLARRFSDWAARFRAYCVDKAGIPAANVVTLSGDAAAALKALAELTARTAPADQFVLFIVAHGDTADGEAAIALPGRDLRISELAAALARNPAQRQVVLHLGAASGEAVTALAARHRVVLTATSPGELTDPVFAEFFLHALERAPSEHPLNLLDAFNAASHETARWIRRLHQTESGAWRVDGKQSIALFHKLCDGPADAAGARALDPASQPVEPEPAVPLITPADPAAAQQLNIPARIRIVSEHALLADTGRDSGVAAVTEKGFTAIPAGKPGEPGHLASQTILGKP